VCRDTRHWHTTGTYGVAVVSQWFRSGVPVVCQWCASGVPVVCHWCGGDAKSAPLAGGHRCRCVGAPAPHHCHTWAPQGGHASHCSWARGWSSPCHSLAVPPLCFSVSPSRTLLFSSTAAPAAAPLQALASDDSLSLLLSRRVPPRAFPCEAFPVLEGSNDFFE